ncbi:hypothetical protein GCM10007888_28700 [Methylobacterium oxalidis]|nr:hypothetical protein GCM10007888_28700 [Methylobacterium oxalidis]
MVEVEPNGLKASGSNGASAGISLSETGGSGTGSGAKATGGAPGKALPSEIAVRGATSLGGDATAVRIPVRDTISFEVKPFHLPILKIAVGPTASSKGVEAVVRLKFWDSKARKITATPHGFKSLGDGVFERRKALEASPLGHSEEVPLVPPYGAVRGEAVLLLEGNPAEQIPTEQLEVHYQNTCREWREMAMVGASPDGNSSGTPIIYSTSAGPFRDDVLRLRPHYLSENFGKLGFEVTYIPLSDTIPVAKPAPGITQMRRSDYFLHLQDILQRRTKPGIFICSSLCDSQTFLMIDLLKERGWKILYEVRDDPEGMKAAGAGYGKWYNSGLERRMCQTADVVITVSGPLRDRAIAFGAREEAVHVLPNGLEEEAFRYLEQNWSEAAIGGRNSRRSKVGYFGHMFGGRFDVDAVAQAARELPEVQFELIGPGLHDPKQLAADNIKLFGQRSIDEFYEISSTWDVGILPFKVNRITFSLDPIKYYQYLAAGLKVVHSDVHNLRGTPFTFLYAADKSLSKTILRALASPVTMEDGRVVREYLSLTTWESRAADTLKYLGYAEQSIGKRA